MFKSYYICTIAIRTRLGVLLVVHTMWPGWMIIYPSGTMMALLKHPAQLWLWHPTFTIRATVLDPSESSSLGVHPLKHNLHMLRVIPLTVSLSLVALPPAMFLFFIPLGKGARFVQTNVVDG